MLRDSNRYDTIQQQAAAGDPHAMLELSKLYQMGVFMDSSDEQYLYWLKQFFSSPIIEAILIIADAEDPEELDDNYYRSEAIVSEIGVEAEAFLLDDIVEAGIELGLYYWNSNKKEDLYCARDALYGAWIANKLDFMEVEVSGEKTDVISILTMVLDRIRAFGYEEEIS